LFVIDAEGEREGGCVELLTTSLVGATFICNAITIFITLGVVTDLLLWALFSHASSFPLPFFCTALFSDLTYPSTQKGAVRLFCTTGALCVTLLTLGRTTDFTGLKADKERSIATLADGTISIHATRALITRPREETQTQKKPTKAPHHTHILSETTTKKSNTQ
tara:strand:- start:41051 stop:41542 length:492 start_codon:yes stop_codon:yes gene_type:complete